MSQALATTEFGESYDINPKAKIEEVFKLALSVMPNPANDLECDVEITAQFGFDELKASINASISDRTSDDDKYKMVDVGSFLCVVSDHATSRASTINEYFEAVWPTTKVKGLNAVIAIEDRLRHAVGCPKRPVTAPQSSIKMDIMTTELEEGGVIRSSQSFKFKAKPSEALHAFQHIAWLTTSLRRPDLNTPQQALVSIEDNKSSKDALRFIIRDRGLGGRTDDGLLNSLYHAESRFVFTRNFESKINSDKADIESITYWLPDRRNDQRRLTFSYEAMKALLGYQEVQEDIEEKPSIMYTTRQVLALVGEKRWVYLSLAHYLKEKVGSSTRSVSRPKDSRSGRDPRLSNFLGKPENRAELRKDIRAWWISVGNSSVSMLENHYKESRHEHIIEAPHFDERWYEGVRTPLLEGSPAEPSSATLSMRYRPSSPVVPEDRMINAAVDIHGNRCLWLTYKEFGKRFGLQKNDHVPGGISPIYITDTFILFLYGYSEPKWGQLKLQSDGVELVPPEHQDCQNLQDLLERFLVKQEFPRADDLLNNENEVCECHSEHQKEWERFLEIEFSGNNNKSTSPESDSSLDLPPPKRQNTGQK
ncbi:hypothetical protein EJ05DRAFT_487282 [Pseudovirgaria hyperparasitica]|uniref:Uncharacterized protein n=1 Tax=Pseudovirgaria hyperparasitica TaxID=470096 RepID=A0A6A6W363_9PEZI|nr:uncharacterized protein EJ05DRAFT_487282 [Pseudovirgaria hyperparasitica]KAF2756370.1 hypothetical protein EJ05DRAFT_487282 [Pseudovirgaria hyperparasitica]